MKREKNTGPRMIFVEHLDGLESNDFCDFDKPSAPIRKKRLSPTSKARREASRNEFVEKGGMPDRVKIFGEVDSRQNRPRTWSGFVKPIRNRLRKEQDLTQSRPSKAEPAWRGERMKLDSRKKSRQDGMMHSKSFET